MMQAVSTASLYTLPCPGAETTALLRRIGLTRAWLQAELDRVVTEQLKGAPPLAALEERIQSLFLQRRQQLQTVVLSLLQLDDAELAQEFYFRIKNREADFHDLSHHSLGSERFTLGRVGPLEYGRLSPLLQELVNACASKEVHPPVELEGGQVVILRVEHCQEASLDQAMRARLAQELYQEWCQTTIARLEPLVEQASTEQQAIQFDLSQLLHPTESNIDG